MKVFSKIQVFVRLSFRRKLLLSVLFLLSLYSYIMLLFFKKKAKFGERNKPVVKSGSVDMELVKDISFAIRIVSKYSPWQNVCRHQAFQAKMLCDFNKIPYTIYIGVKKNEDGVLEGHAWTIVNEQFMTGFCKVEEYVIQTSFS
ncbi:lasso peptide biosynthesis B2 protein [Emticicia sp. BO119]|uniref:lasso peptide biosynthesis B2 protein n=1 Tax=Emticicia sp. BO119 TaxID=2757768 RepID=UPI0015EFE204|nr:lasso peptide biosynthesis B2 protein [Emticicia sp. BO119]MBA4853669.1 lasso peptide biosynthesis B2 protein [Emticicia sp. BO119]